MASKTVADLTQLYDSLKELVDDLRNDGLTGVNFETNVEPGDCVYLETDTNTFKRCLANSPQVPEREKFHGIAKFPENESNFVRIYGFDSSDDYKIYDETDVENPVLLQAFVPGQYIYISQTAAGGYTQTENDSPVGVAVGIDMILLASELDNASGAVRQLITNALVQNVIDYDPSFRQDATQYVTLKGRLDALLAVIGDTDDTIAALDDEVVLNGLEVEEARNGEVSLNARLVSVDALINANTLEITTARGNESSLNARISAEANKITLIQQVLLASAGSMSDLTARLAVAINNDGTLKTTVSASTYTTETETATRTSTSTFTLPGDLTGVYETGRAIRFNDTITAHVLTSVFGTVTTVTTVTAVVPASIAKVEYSFSPAELPLMAHSQLSNIETVDPTQTDTTRNKHVSDNDLKTLQDQITVNASDINTNEAAIALNTAKTGITTEQSDAIVANTAKRSYPSADETKLGTIAEGAEVNVQSDWNAASGDALILNKPTIPAAQVQSDWDATSGLGEVLNKPTLSITYESKTLNLLTAATYTAPANHIFAGYLPGPYTEPANVTDVYSIGDSVRFTNNSTSTNQTFIIMWITLG